MRWLESQVTSRRAVADCVCRTTYEVRGRRDERHEPATEGRVELIQPEDKEHEEIENVPWILKVLEQRAP